MSKMRTRCFVIMPISQTTAEHTEEYWTNNFKDFLKPAIEECPELEACRSEPLRGDILKEIIKELVACPIVIADLTDLNANVFWELGVRQSFRHGTVTIAEKGTKIPFDVGVKGTLFYYPKDHIKNAMFIKRFKEALNDCLINIKRPDSHVLETISGRGTLFQIIRREESIRRVKALIAECELNTAFSRHVYETIEENQKERYRTYVTDRFRFSAIELLLTNRYLDEDDSFYTKAMLAHSALQMKNSQLEKWRENPEEVERWFLKPELKAQFTAKVKDFEEELRKILKKLLVSC